MFNLPAFLGVQVGRREYTFAGQSGVYSTEPRCAPGAKFREAISIGRFDGTSSELEAILDDLRLYYGPDDYHLLTRNCNTFSDSFLFRLLNKRLPGYINRMAYFGYIFSCCLPPSLMENSPVPNPGDDDASSTSSLSSFGPLHRSGGGGGGLQPAAGTKGGYSRLSGHHHQHYRTAGGGSSSAAAAASSSSVVVHRPFSGPGNRLGGESVAATDASLTLL